MRRLGWLSLFLLGLANASDLRNFPPSTMFGRLSKISYPQIQLSQLPSNWGSGLIGLIWLPTCWVAISPATIIRDEQNITHVQNYLNQLIDQPVAVQLDYQGRAWTIWQLTAAETKSVVASGRNQLTCPAPPVN